MDTQLVDILSALTGAIVSLAFEFFPKIKDWFASLTKYQKQLTIGAVSLVLGFAMYASNCAGLLYKFFPEIIMMCDEQGAVLIFRVAIAVMGGAQAVHIAFNKPVEMAFTKGR